MSRWRWASSWPQQVCCGAAATESKAFTYLITASLSRSRLTLSFLVSPGLAGAGRHLRRDGQRGGTAGVAARSRAAAVLARLWGGRHQRRNRRRAPPGCAGRAYSC
jgi:hypothetical protein